MLEIPSLVFKVDFSYIFNCIKKHIYIYKTMLAILHQIQIATKQPEWAESQKALSAVANQ